MARALGTNRSSRAQVRAGATWPPARIPRWLGPDAAPALWLWPAPPAISYFGLVALLAVCLAADIVLVDGGAERISISLIEIVAWAAFALVLAGEVAEGRLDIVARPIAALPALAGYLLWCAIAVTAVLGVSGSTETIGLFKSLLPGYLIFAIVVCGLRRMEQCSIIVWILIIGALVNALLAIAQFYWGIMYLIPEIEGNAEKADLTGALLERTAIGLYTSANGLGPAIAPGFVLALAFVPQRLSSGRILVGSALILAVAVIGFGLFLTYSKASIFWAALGGMVALWPYRRLKGVVCLTVVVVGMASLVAYGYSQGAGEGPVTVNTLLVRTKLWQAAWAVIHDQSFGWCFGGLSDEMLLRSYTFAKWRYPNAHNTWINQVLYFGGPALLLYALSWFSVLRRLGQALVRAGRADAAIINGLFGAHTAVIGILFLEPRGEGVLHIAQAMLLLGLSVAVARRASGEPGASPNLGEDGDQQA